MNLKKMLKSEKGFSLIELLIVIGILTIIAIIIIPRFSTSSEEAKKATDAANVKLLQSAVERYHFDKGTYPVDGDDLPTGDTPESIKQELLLTGKYISDKAKNPDNKSQDGDYKIDKNGTVQPLKP